MSFRITMTACQSHIGNQPMANVLKLNPAAHIFSGDYDYNDYSVNGGVAGFNGKAAIPNVTYDQTGATAGSTTADAVRRFVDVYGYAGLRTYVDFWNGVKAKGIAVFMQADDHSAMWNNNDHTAAIANNVFTPNGTTIPNQAGVLWQWNIGAAAKRQIEAAYSNNPPVGAPNGDIPLAMLGVSNGSDYAVEYFYKDFDNNGVYDNGGTALRVIFPDAISYKDPQFAFQSGTWVYTGNTLTPTGLLASNGNASNVSVFFPGTALQFTVSGGTLPSGVVAGTTYYVSSAGYSVGATTFQIAPTLANALAGTNSITLSGGSGTWSFTNVGKTLFGKTQLAWIKSTIQAAVAKGIQSIVIASTKDLFNVDNNDGPWQYAAERDALLLWIHQNNYPVSWLCGDKHYPHVGISRVANGDPYDAIGVCACPFGQGMGTLTQYRQNVWAYGRADGTVIGSIFVDTDAKTTTLTIHDAWSLDPLFSAVIPFGARIPNAGGITTSVTAPTAHTPAPFVNTVTPTTGAYIYKNTDNRPQLVTVAGGTVTNIARSRDNNVFTTIPLPTTGLGSVLGGDFYLAPGDMLKITNTVVPVVTVTPL